MDTPTAADSGALLKFLADTKLRLDSFLPCKRRGAWVHGVSKKRLENDVFLTDVDPNSKRWHNMNTFTTPRFDHRGTLADFMLYGDPKKQQIKKQQQEAKEEAQRIKSKTRIRWDLMRGGSSWAKDNRKI